MERGRSSGTSPLERHPPPCKVGGRGSGSREWGPGDPRVPVAPTSGHRPGTETGYGRSDVWIPSSLGPAVEASGVDYSVPVSRSPPEVADRRQVWWVRTPLVSSTVSVGSVRAGGGIVGSMYLPLRGLFGVRSYLTPRGRSQSPPLSPSFPHPRRQGVDKGATAVRDPLPLLHPTDICVGESPRGTGPKTVSLWRKNLSFQSHPTSGRDADGTLEFLEGDRPLIDDLGSGGWSGSAFVVSPEEGVCVSSEVRWRQSRGSRSTRVFWVTGRKVVGSRRPTPTGPGVVRRKQDRDGSGPC